MPKATKAMKASHGVKEGGRTKMHPPKKHQMPRSEVVMLKAEVEAFYEKLCRNTIRSRLCRNTIRNRLRGIDEKRQVDFLNEEARVALDEAYEIVRHQLPLKRNEGESIRAFVIKSAFTKRYRKRQLKRR